MSDSSEETSSPTVKSTPRTPCGPATPGSGTSPNLAANRCSMRSSGGLSGTTWNEVVQLMNNCRAPPVINNTR
eukprot:1036764-Pyramimonas_sp.AAC.1